jgi:hypothetical protein
MKLMALTLHEQSEEIAAIDSSFISKSRHNTQGLGSFYNGSAGDAKQYTGLEHHKTAQCIIVIQPNVLVSINPKEL